ncbi:MAG: CehA/McbA family metallohydrolase [Sandaracinaceae bacterium]
MTHLIPHDAERYLREARVVPEADGHALYAVAWQREGESLVRFSLADDGAVGEAETLERSEGILAVERAEGRPAITNDPGATDRETRGEWSVRIERRQGCSRVVAVHLGREHVVFDAYGTAAAPTVVPTKDGAWVAFHHNVREDTGEPDLSKWIALRFVRLDGRVFEPDAEMTGRNRDLHGEEQSWEYPSLAVAEDGSLALFGRGAHAFHRQDLAADGFTPRRPLGGTDWGCRGRWVSVSARIDGRLMTARREKTGVAVAVLPGSSGGAPALREAVVELARRPHRDVPPRPKGPDPAARDGRRTLFGDIHQHSAHSDGIGTPDEPYLRARYVYGDDFCALTDHESFIGKRIGPGEWAHLVEVAERHDDPGSFATLLAYEWTGRMYPGPGHKVVYLPPSGGAIIGRDDVPDGAELVRRVKEAGGFAVPHHVGWTGADEPAHDPEGQPVWEICSCHGCYLYADHPLGGRGELKDQMVEEVMRRGRRFGFIACSDGHGLLYHHGVGRKRDPFRCGLTAVQAEDTTRESILAAIRERRCYATSGVPILLDLRAGDAPMGSACSVDGPVTVSAMAEAATPIRSLVLRGPDGVIAKTQGEGTSASLDAEVPPGWVYARVETEDGEMAWSSPIFLDLTP